MPLQLEVTSEQKELMGDDAVRRFNGQGATIGRGLQSDWILPDTQRFISGKHATIDFQSGVWYIADVSTNGVYINDANEPLGRGNPRRLFDGDRLRMGDFEFTVKIDENDELDAGGTSSLLAVTGSADHMDQRVPEEPLRTGIQLLDEEELTGDEEFQSAMFGTARMDREPAAKAERGAEPANPFRPPPPDTGPRGEDVLQAFLEGAGVDRDALPPSADPLELMTTAGQLLRELVDGAATLLTGRANMKSMFRLDQTTVLPRHNNPLKLSAGTGESMQQLLVGKEGQYLGPLESVKEVCRDLKFHQDAMFEAMLTAFREFADRFDPDELQDNFDRNMERKPLLGSLAKLKYWELYCDLYPIMTQSGSGPFPQHFGEEFVRAYEKHIAEYKRVDRGDGKAA